MPTEITSLEQFKEITGKDEYSVIDFWAEWCGPCKAVAPVFQALEAKPENAHVKFYKVNVEDHEDISRECGIRAMPTFMLFKDGNKVDTLTGARPPLLEALIGKAVIPK